MIKRFITTLALFSAISACTLPGDKYAASQPHSVQPFAIIEATISDVHQAIKSGQTTCEELITTYLNRIETYDQAAGLNAIIYINPKAITRARQLDKQFIEKHTMRDLHCIPTIVKDNFDTADMPTEAGSTALKGSVPPDDAFMVKKLREADAVIIAKSNMGEWAFSPYHTISSTHGETRNAYNLDHVPAGSSGGTASAIAANFAVIGLGTDTGNSIRGPASHLSLVGIRSTIGATSRDGIVPLLLNRDIGGPLVRSVEDAVKVFNVIAGYDPADPITLLGRDKVEKNYKKYLRKDGLVGARLGVLRHMYESETADLNVMALMEKAILDLREAGAIIIDPLVIPQFEELSSATGFCSRFRHDLKLYLNSLGDSAPIHSLDDVAKNKAYLSDNEGAMKWAMEVAIAPEEQEPPCVDVAGDPRRYQFLSAVEASMEQHGVDAIIYPSWSNPPRKIGDTQSPHGNNSPVIAPHTGQPAITVPMGYVDGNLPIGLQFLGRPFHEGDLFQFAYAYEQQTLHRVPPELFP